MQFAISEEIKLRKKRKIHPLTLILINAMLPVLNTVFPSSKGVFFTVIFVFFLLLISGCYKKALTAAVWTGAFFGLYAVTLLWIQNEILASMFRMFVLFLPSVLLASLLITEYNSSEILSSLEKLHLPKIFVISLTVTLRYIPTFRREFLTIRDAMYIRGVRFSIRHPVRTFEYLLVPQLFRCLSLSGELTAAALTKGINAPGRRTSYFAQPFSPPDFLAFAVLIIGYGLIIGKVI